MVFGCGEPIFKAVVWGFPLLESPPPPHSQHLSCASSALNALHQFKIHKATSTANILIPNIKYLKHQNDNLSTHLQQSTSRTSPTNPPLHLHPHSLQQRPRRKPMLSSKLPTPALLSKGRPLYIPSHRPVSHHHLNRPPNEKRCQRHLSPPTTTFAGGVTTMEERDGRDGTWNLRTHW